MKTFTLFARPMRFADEGANGQVQIGRREYPVNLMAEETLGMKSIRLIRFLSMVGGIRHPLGCL